jgi:hypothetical protein
MSSSISTTPASLSSPSSSNKPSSGDVEYHGACACEKVQYTIRNPQNKHVEICHCFTCQAWSGGVGLFWSPKEQEVSFYDTTHVKIWKSSDWGIRAFCDICGSSLYSMITTGPMNGTYHFCPCTLKHWNGLSVDGQYFVDRKPLAYDFTAVGKKLTAEETLALYTS